MAAFTLLLVLLLQQVMAEEEEVPIGLILHERSARLEQAFDFARMVLNHNLLPSGQTPPCNRKKPVMYTVGRNRTDLSDSYKMGSAICSLVAEGVHAVIATSHPTTYNTIQSYSHALHVPFILASQTRETGRDQYHYDINLSPPFANAVLKVIAGIPRSQKLYYVYDTDDGLWRLQRLYEFFQKKPDMARPVDAFRIRNVNSAYSIFRGFDMKDNDVKVIVLDLESANAYRLILEQIIDVGMNRDEYHYILAGAGALDLNIDRDFFSQFLYGGVNITAFSFVTNITNVSRQWEQIWRRYQDDFANLFPLTSDAALMMDAVRIAYEAIKCTNTQTFPQSSRGRSQNDARCGLSTPHQPSTIGTRIMNSVSKVEFEGLTGPIKFHKRIRSDYSLDAYKLRFKSKMKKVDTWRPGDLHIESFAGVPVHEEMANRTQQVTTVDSGQPKICGHNLEGYCIDLLRMVAERVDFDYCIKMNPTNIYGSNINGSWNGMIGELVRGTKDIAIAPLTITEERERVVDFTKPFMNTGISIMIKKPDRQKPGVFSFMEPLDKWVWLCIAIGFLGVSFVLFFVGRFSPYEWQVSEDSGKDATATNTFSISNTLWFSLGALMQQGSDISPRSLSGRIIGSAWWFFTLIIISSYTANLAAFLTVEKLVSPIDSADDLVEHPTIKYGTLSSGTSWNFFKESAVETFQRMREAMDQNKDEVLVDEVKVGVAKVRSSKGEYAFLLESAMNNYHSQQKPCDVMPVGEPLDNKGYGIASRIGHPLRQKINIAVLELGEIGELYKLQQKWWYDKGKCGDLTGSKESAGSQSALTLSNVSGIFHILIGGLVLAMITSSIEYLVQRHLTSRAGKNNHVCKAPPPPPPPRRSCYQTTGRADYKTSYYENEM
ncbi:hypothetical protein BaRGS_00013496, partial [Batillaria attramentaria]